MLNLKGLKQVSVVETEGQYEIEATVTGEAPVCSCLLPNVRKNGRRKSLFFDTPMHGKKVGIWVQRQRYQCTNCHRTIYEKIPHMHPSHDMTDRLVKYIQTNGTERTFTAIAQEIGVDVQTVRGIWRTHAQKELDRLCPVTPEWMGIDELHVMHAYRGVITNVKDRTIVDMLENRKKETVVRYLVGLHDKEKIKIVTMDMWEQYREAVTMVLPWAKIVVDRFHISRMAGEAMERVRKQVMKALEDKGEALTMKGDRFLFLTGAKKLDWGNTILLESNLGRFPLLMAAWKAKEAYRAIWDHKSRQDAEAAYDKWVAELDPTVAKAFEDLVTAMANWRTEIFNYFEHRLTNSYTEGFNAIARRMDRMGRGYSFKVLRAKLLLKYSCHKAAPPRKFSRANKRDEEIMRRLDTKMRLLIHDLGPKAVSTHLGVDISTLAKWLETLPEKG